MYAAKRGLTQESPRERYRILRSAEAGVGARGAQRRQIHDDILEIAHAAGSIRLLEPRLQLGFGELVVGVMALQ